MKNETPLPETRGGPRRTSGNPFTRVVNKFRHLEAYSIGSIPSRGSDGVLIVNGPDFSYEFRYFENKWEISEKIGTAHVQGRRWDCLDRFLDDVSSRHGFRKKRNPSRIIKSIKARSPFRQANSDRARDRLTSKSLASKARDPSGLIVNGYRIFLFLGLQQS